MSSATNNANNQSVRAWLKSLLAKDKDKEPPSEPLTIATTASSSGAAEPPLDPPSDEANKRASTSVDMISFHHAVSDTSEDHPASFSPPARSFSGGSGPISYQQAAQASAAQPVSRHPPLSSSSSGAFSVNIEPPSPVTSDLSSSPSRPTRLARNLSQSVQTLHERIKHQRRASETFKRYRAGSDAGSDISESSTAHAAGSKDGIASSSNPGSGTASSFQATGSLIKSSDIAFRLPFQSVDTPASRSLPTSPSLNKIQLPSEPLSPPAASDPGTQGESSSCLLLPEGEPMLKVSHKKVKPRTFKLDPDRGQITWESKKNNKLDLESIREVRFGASAASYRTALNISNTHEPKWLTIIYQTGGIYKALHLIALSDASLTRWRSSLLHLQSLRRELIQGINSTGNVEQRRNIWMRHHWRDADQSKDEKLSLDEVLKLCRRLGIENSRSDLQGSFIKADWRNRGFLDFDDFQTFVRILKRRQDVELIFSVWADTELPKTVDDSAKQAPASSSASGASQVSKPPAVLPEQLRTRGISLANFKHFLIEEQQCTTLSDAQISELFVRHSSASIFPTGPSAADSAMDFEGFLNFLGSSDNPPLTDQLPFLTAPAPSSAANDVCSKVGCPSGEKIEPAAAQGDLAPSVDRPRNLQPSTSSSSLSGKFNGKSTPSRAHAETPEELIAAGASDSPDTRRGSVPLRKSAVTQDMSRPLSDYYISSSHNTYLVGGQWKGDSTVEGYIRALLQGARSVELDCWDGPNMTPCITHGHTLTSKVPFADVITAISRYAFVTSPYPVILSLEVHNDVPQQEIMANVLRDILGDALLSESLDPSKPLADDDELPSPDALKYKVLVKAKNIYLTQSDQTKLEKQAEKGEKNASTEASQQPVTGEVLSASATDTTESENDAVFAGARQLVRRVTQRRSKNAREGAVVGSKSEGKAQKPPRVLMSTALASLLIYTVGVKCRGLNKKEVYANQHMFSLSERTANKFIRDPATRESLIKHNRTHLSRIYPSMSSFARLHASRNFLPLDMWAAGCQLVALNWQTTDLGFELNQAMFTRNGRCGYVLKPPGLRIKEKLKESGQHLRFCIDLKVISAQQLPRQAKEGTKEKDADDRDPIDPFVSVTLLTPDSWGKQPRSFLRDSSAQSPGVNTNLLLEPNPDNATRQQPQRSSSLPIDESLLEREPVIEDDAISLTESQNSRTGRDSGPQRPSVPHLDTSVMVSAIISDEPDSNEGPLVTGASPEAAALTSAGAPSVTSAGEQKTSTDPLQTSNDPGGALSSIADALSAKSSRSRLRTPTVKGNGFSPHWNTSMSILVEVPAGSDLDLGSLESGSSSKVDVHKLSRGLLDLCFLRFEVYDEDLGLSDAASSNSSNSSFDSDCVAAYAVPIGSLQPGYRHLPLYDAQLSQFLFSTLFVYSRIRFVGLTGRKKDKRRRLDGAD